MHAMAFRPPLQHVSACSPVPNTVEKHGHISLGEKAEKLDIRITHASCMAQFSYFEQSALVPV